MIDANALAKDLELLAKHEDSFRQSVILGVVHTVKAQPTVDAVPIEELERILSATPGLELWDYQKTGIMSAVKRLFGKEINDG